MDSSFPGGSRSAARVLALAPGHRYFFNPGQPARIESADHQFALPALPPAFHVLIGRLPLARTLAIRAAEEIGPEAMAMLRALARLGCLEETLYDPADRKVLHVSRPVLTGATGLTVDWVRVRLHDHAFLRASGSRWMLMRVGSPAVVTFDARAGLLKLLDFLAAGVEVTAPTLVEELLLENGFLVSAGTSEVRWEFQDALLHSVSVHGEATEFGYGARTVHGRRGARNASPLGGIGEERATVRELATVTSECGPTFEEVLAKRQSCRLFSSEPITAEVLGVLLDLALRERRRPRASVGDAVFHAYPSAGARDELMTIVAGSDAEVGLGVYLPRTHELARIDRLGNRVSEVIDDLSRPCGITVPTPSVALIFAADYERMASKYEAIAYANILRNVGAVYQTVSLAVTALGLGSCAVGGGWGLLERNVLTELLGGRSIVGGMLLGRPRGPGS